MGKEDFLAWRGMRSTECPLVMCMSVVVLLTMVMTNKIIQATKNIRLFVLIPVFTLLCSCSFCMYEIYKHCICFHSLFLTKTLYFLIY